METAGKMTHMKLYFVDEDHKENDKHDMHETIHMENDTHVATMKTIGKMIHTK